jgi:hypothetical protein
MAAKMKLCVALRTAADQRGKSAVPSGQVSPATPAAGRGACRSMHDALKKSPKVQGLVAARLPGRYSEWFDWWAYTIRQAVKDGVDFNAQLVDGRLGIVFALVTVKPPRQQVGLATHETLFLGDLACALE